jgi:hypothetical protein
VQAPDEHLSPSPDDLVLFQRRRTLENSVTRLEKSEQALDDSASLLRDMDERIATSGTLRPLQSALAPGDGGPEPAMLQDDRLATLLQGVEHARRKLELQILRSERLLARNQSLMQRLIRVERFTKEQLIPPQGNGRYDTAR